MPIKKAKKVTRVLKPLKSKDLPATFGDLDNVRNELKSDITSVRLEIKSVDSKVSGLDAKVNSLDSKVNRLDLKIVLLEKNMNSRFESMDSKFEDLKSTNYRMLALLEEQNSRNRVALDGYAAVYAAQQSLELRVDKVEKFQFELEKNLKAK